MTTYTIKTMSDFLALSPDQRKRCVADMLFWAAFVDEVRATKPPLFETPDTMTWCDDDRQGEISAIHIHTVKP